MSGPKKELWETPWLFVIPAAVIVAMLFVLGYYIVYQYEGGGAPFGQAVSAPAEPAGEETEAEPLPAAEPAASAEKAESGDGAAEGAADAAPEFTVNINTADAEELKRLPGVSDVMAGRIIQTRERLGGFRRIEDIRNVSGIGEKIFGKMEPFLTVE